MNEIFMLNAKVASLIPPKCENLPEINRAGVERWPESSSHLREEAERVKVILAELIPDDFDFSILLGEEKPNCSLRYSDGPQAGMGMLLELQEDECLEVSLGSEDWDLRRAKVLQETKFFGQVSEVSKSFPVQLPSTKELQRAYRDHLKAWIKQVRRDSSKVFVFVRNQNNELIQIEFDSLGEFEDELSNIMVYRNYVIGIVAEGKPLPIDRIDRIKTKTLRSMAVDMPISYAKATGQFAQAMQAMSAMRGSVDL